MTMPNPPSGEYTRSVHQTGTNAGTPVSTESSTPVTLSSAVLAPYQAKVRDAEGNKARASQQVTELQKQLAQTPAQNDGLTGPEDNPAFKAINDQLVRAMSLYDAAAREQQDALSKLADATSKEAARADPTNREALSAAAAQARTQADAAAAQYQEFQQTAPERRAGVVAQQRAQTLANDQAQLNLDYQRETDPIRKQSLQQQLQQGQANLTTAQADAQVAQQTVGARVTVANQAVTQGQQTITAGDIANQTGQANLQDLLRRVRQAPSDEQALSALQTALEQGQANLGATQAGTAATTAGTARTNQLLPGEVAQQGATLANTEAGTDATRAATAQTKFGGLAGLDDYIAAQKDAIAKGLISPDQADQGLVARISGTDVFNASKEANDAMMARTNQQITQRAEEINLASNKASTLGGMANTGLGQFMNLNNTVQPGSDAAGRGLLGYLGMAQDMLGQYQAPPREASPALPPMLQSFAGGGGQAQPAQASGAGHTITINIGGTAPGSAQEANGPTNDFQTNEPGVRNSIAPQYTGAPMQQPALLDKMQPAMPEHVAAILGMNGQQPFAQSGIAEGSRR